MSKLFATISLTVLAFVLIAMNACQDPGCIRNSECGSAYNCTNSRCVLIPTATNTAGSSSTASITLSDSGQTASTPSITLDAGQTISPEASTDATTP
jgi:hypothetical protein